MKHCILLLLISLFSTPFYCYGQINTGARSAGMGGYSVALKDLWSTENNTAGLTNQSAASAGIYYDNRFLLKELSYKALVACLPMHNAGVGLNLAQFGNHFYNQSKIALAYGRKLAEKLQMGVQISYLRTHLAENYGNSHAIAANIGIIAELTDNLSLATSIINPNKARIAESLHDAYPSLIRLGMNYHFSKKVLLGTEIEKSLENKSILKLGVEYHIIEKLFLRCGVASSPSIFSFGFGLLMNDFKLDFATSYHSILGHSPQISLSYSAFSEKSNE